MKTHILTLAAIAALIIPAASDTPDAILKDYRTRAVQATQRLDETLNKQAAAIITDLVRKGDTAGAEAVTAQVKQKTAGEPLTNIHAAAVTLFAQYDGARATAMKPVQTASIARLDSLLKVAGGPKIDALAEITKVRAEIEAGKLGAGASIPQNWDYYTTLEGRKTGTLMLRSDGTFELLIPTSSQPSTDGTWTVQKPNVLRLACAKEKWEVVVNGDTATIERPGIGVRYLKRLSAQISNAPSK